MTHLLLPKNYFHKIMNFTHSLKKSLFPGDFESPTASKIAKSNSHGSIFVIISCQRVIQQVQKMGPGEKGPPDFAPEIFAKDG